ncbi:MAG: hypothetical protein FJ220_01015, partial [Kiritimatiellaceae bacterium]|nr:hypothetical protein [Kiritimatiellaceae bacterium]
MVVVKKGWFSMLGGDFQRRIKTWFRRHLSGVVKHQPPVMLSPWVHFALLASVISEVFELELFFNESLRPVLDLLVLGVYAVVVWQISRRAMVVGAIVLPGGIAEMLNVWGTPQWTVDFQSGFSFLCHFALAVVLMRRILTTRHISSREILDAISLYVIAALAFANLYGAILWNHPGALTCFY